MNEKPAIEPLNIRGDCIASELSEADRNRLTRVEGELDASNTTGLTLPALKSCVTLDAEDSTGLNIPLLTSVSGNLFAGNTTDLSLPALEKCGNLDAGYTTALTLPALESVEGKLNALNATGLIIPAAIASEHSIPAECLAAVPEQSHVEKALSELQNANESLNQGIK